MMRYVNIEGDLEGIACALVEGVLTLMLGKLKAIDMQLKNKGLNRGLRCLPWLPIACAYS